MPDKAALRQQMRTVLAGMPDPVKAEASAKLRDRLKSWHIFQQVSVIAAFHPTRTEPDLLPLLGFPEKTFLFPLCHADRSLTWHRPDGIDQWRPSRFGILEPDPAVSPPVPAPSIELILVPGLAFTDQGDRLGHGIGFYDRFLASISRGTATAGICFSCQIMRGLPVEGHDIKLDTMFHA